MAITEEITNEHIQKRVRSWVRYIHAVCPRARFWLDDGVQHRGRSKRKRSYPRRCRRVGR